MINLLEEWDRFIYCEICFDKGFIEILTGKIVNYVSFLLNGNLRALVLVIY